MVKLAVTSGIDSGVLRSSTLRDDGRIKVLVTLDETKWHGNKTMVMVRIEIISQMQETPYNSPFQSDKEVYLLAALIIAKESREILKEWLSPLNEQLKHFNQPQNRLSIPGLGLFEVEVHLAVAVKNLSAICTVNSAAMASKCSSLHFVT